MCMQSIGGMMQTGENRSASASPTLSTIHFPWIEMGSEMGFLSKRPAMSTQSFLCLLDRASS